MPEIGEISESPCVPKVVMWTIPDFTSLPKEDGYFAASPRFSFDGITWRLTLFPYGTREMLGCSTLFLSPPFRYNNSLMEWVLKIKKQDGTPRLKTLKTCRGSLADLRSSRFEVKALLASYEGLRKNCLSPDGSLKVLCELSYRVQRIKAVQTETNPRTDRLVQDLRELLVSQENSDFTIRVRGEEFKVHRSILGARTPVFASMFHHEMTEKTTGVVTIDDCDADAFRTFLSFVYTGTAENICTKNVFSLHEVSDKYQQDELKAECIEFMKTNLSADTLCEAILVGHMYNEQELTDKAETFLSEHLKDIIDDEKWKKFESDNPQLANELLLEAIRLQSNSVS